MHLADQSSARTGTMFGTAAALAAIVLLVPAAAAAKAHLWRFTEFFSNGDGSIQFIEMQECCGSSEEVRLRNWDLRSNTKTYIFPNNLSGDTAYQHLLIATQSFADLPGAPTPDYIIPPHFFNPNGDTLTYRQNDAVTITPGALPTDGVDSIDRNLAVQTNDPTNFAGETGSVAAPTPVPALLPTALAALLVALIGASAIRPRRWREAGSRQ